MRRELQVEEGVEILSALRRELSFNPVNLVQTIDNCASNLCNLWAKS